MEKARLIKYLKLAIKIGVTAAIAYLIYRKRDKLGVVFELLGEAHIGWLLLALLSFLFSKFISTFRLQQFLRARGVRLTHGYNIRLYLLGMYYNLFLPGSIGGDGYKMLVLSRKFEVKKRNLVWAFLLDRISGVVSLVALLLLMVLFVPYPEYLPIAEDWLSWFSAALYASIPLVFLGHFLGTWLFFRRYSKIFLSTSALSMVVQVFQIVAAFCILQALSGSTKLLEYGILFQLSSIAAVLPITLGGMGAREAVFTIGAEWLGTDPGKSLLIGSLFYVITVLSSLMGIYFSYRPDKLESPKDQFPGDQPKEVPLEAYRKEARQQAETPSPHDQGMHPSPSDS